MLRDARQLAISQVVEALLDAAHVHEEGAELLAGKELSATLRTLAEQRRDAALRLGDHLRALGDLPSEPDADLQTARDLLARLQAALATDQRDQVLRRCRETEEQLVEMVRLALAEALAPDTRAILEQLLTAPELRAAPDSS
jgi:hypothetical protein